MMDIFFSLFEISQQAKALQKGPPKRPRRANVSGVSKKTCHCPIEKFHLSQKEPHIRVQDKQLLRHSYGTKARFLRNL